MPIDNSQVHCFLQQVGIVQICVSSQTIISYLLYGKKSAKIMNDATLGSVRENLMLLLFNVEFKPHGFIS